MYLRQNSLTRKYLKKVERIRKIVNEFGKCLTNLEIKTGYKKKEYKFVIKMEFFFEHKEKRNNKVDVF